MQLQGPGWNDFVEYFRELDETLQATTAPEQVMAQQERLGKVLTEWSSKIKAIRKRLMGLARDLEQDISEAVVVIDALGAVCQKTEPHDLQTFADIFAEQFERDGQKFKSAVATSHRLEELDRIYIQPLAEAVRYLEHIQELFKAECHLWLSERGHGLWSICMLFVWTPVRLRQPYRLFVSFMMPTRCDTCPAFIVATAVPW